MTEGTATVVYPQQTSSVNVKRTILPPPDLRGKNYRMFK